MMKKMISFCFASLFLCVVSFGQESTATANTKKAECVPTKECAAKMGMTLEQCKAICSKANKGTAATEINSNANSVDFASSDAAVEAPAKKCCASVEACAAKMGMTVEECKAKCKGHSAEAMSGSTTAVASAVMVSNTEEASKSEKPKTCAKAGKACCAKKQ
jgi:hypothetical protein